VNIRSKAQLSAEVDNPLSTAASNPWNSFYGDSDMKDLINKDIERTYQDMEFFLEKPIQLMLSNILFVWAKQNPDLSYRQGMNELVAVITYICFIENFHAENPDKDLYDFLNDDQYAEADIYTVFKRLLELDQKNMFEVNQPTAKNGKPKKKTDNDGTNRPNLPVVHRAVTVQEELLPKVQPALAEHYQTLQVEPHIYLMRWLRCLLVREFKIQQAVYLWDAMFAYHYKYTPNSKKLEMLDYLCVAMMLNISDELFDIDNGGSLLGKLLKYPPTNDVHSLIKICNSEVIGNNSNGKKTEKKPTTFSYEKATPNPFSSTQEDKTKSTTTATNGKKVVLFNPATPILANEPLKEEKSDPLQAKVSKPTNSSIQSQPLTTPPKTNNNPFGENSSKTQTVTVTSSEKSEKTGFFKMIEDTSSSFLANTKKIINFGQPKQSDQKDPSDPLVLFTAPTEKKESKGTSGGFVVEKKQATTFKDPKVDDVSGSNIHKETHDQIKKLQNAIKHVKLENEKNASLGLNEALEDMNEVLKFLKDKVSKNI